jgi:hypothetical protein
LAASIIAYFSNDVVYKFYRPSVKTRGGCKTTIRIKGEKNSEKEMAVEVFCSARRPFVRVNGVQQQLHKQQRQQKSNGAKGRHQQIPNDRQK